MTSLNPNPFWEGLPEENTNPFISKNDLASTSQPKITPIPTSTSLSPLPDECSCKSCRRACICCCILSNCGTALGVLCYISSYFPRGCHPC